MTSSNEHCKKKVYAKRDFRKTGGPRKVEIGTKVTNDLFPIKVLEIRKE